MRSPLISTAAGAGLVVLAIAGIVATRPPAQVAGQPTPDPAAVAEATFPYPHLTVSAADDRAKLLLDDGSVDPQTRITWTVPRDGSLVRASAPWCDTSDMICWGATTVDPALTTRIDLEYQGVPCVIAGSPAVRTTLQCSEPG